MILKGYLVIVFSILLLVLGTYAVLFSAILPLTGIPVRDFLSCIGSP